MVWAVFDLGLVLNTTFIVMQKRNLRMLCNGFTTVACAQGRHGGRI